MQTDKQEKQEEERKPSPKAIKEEFKQKINKSSKPSTSRKTPASSTSRAVANVNKSVDQVATKPKSNKITSSNKSVEEVKSETPVVSNRYK